MNKSSAAKANPEPPIYFLNRLLSACSIRCLFRLARILAWLVARTPNQLSRKARANITLCFPELDPSRQRDIIEQSLVHTCCSFLELAALWHHSIDKVMERIDIDWIDPGYAQCQKARIVVAPHHGSWELLNFWLAQQASAEFHALYQPASNTALDDYIRRSRSRTGAKLTAITTAGIRSLMRALKNSATCMILPDQRPSRKKARVMANFFGHPAATSLLVKNLAQRSDTEVFIAATTRDLASGRYKLRLERMDRQLLLQDDEASADYLNSAIEAFITPDIAQYQWSYRRFSNAIYAGSGPD